MAWNEPGDKKDKDPWGDQNKEQGPPDLDEVVRKLQEKLSGIFGGKRGSGSGGGGFKAGATSLSIIAAIILTLWAATGLYTVDQGNRGVVLRLGKYLETTDAGLHWRIPFPIDTVEVVNVEEIRNVEIGYRSAGANGQGIQNVPREALMLTQDENIIDIKLAVQYQIKDAKDYLFNVRNPDLTLHQATESALRTTIGKSKMDFVLTEGRSEIVSRTETITQEILDRYGAGLIITSVNMQDAQPPEEVQGAFNDAIKAREDRDRLKNEAEAYANGVLPEARGQSARMLAESNAYKSQVVDQAEGEASRFTQLLTEYKKAPEVTRERLYLDAIEEVLSKSRKVMLDVEGGNNLLYLPLDRIMQDSGRNFSPRSLLQNNQLDSLNATSPQQSTQQRSRRALRSRETR